ncbi:hypothetical protein B0T22DRAFT_43190 [Podospora appendiculata]|uniref:Uncharacterized protein n=1 Tax=Podospora appendiculata TaxID=314037 RepID=A0AAE1CGR2_9PEZI|nr:hypothetical protein B0T22DRAFT_43190 [Podospora appendiculata]
MRHRRFVWVATPWGYCISLVCLGFSNGGAFRGGTEYLILENRGLALDLQSRSRSWNHFITRKICMADANIALIQLPCRPIHETSFTLDRMIGGFHPRGGVYGTSSMDKCEEYFEIMGITGTKARSFLNTSAPIF